MRPTCLASDLRLLVVGDIFAQPAPDICLSRGLPNAAVTRCDLATLSGRPDLQGEALHHYLFNNSGMTYAVTTLRSLITKPTFALGYSAGGTALWKAARHAPLSGLICVSSTRLREESALTIPTLCVFGADDAHRPDDKWCATVPTLTKTLPAAGHSFYADPAGKASKDMRSDIAHTLALWRGKQT